MVVVLPKDVTASDVMNKNAIIIAPDKTVNDARFLFRTHRIGGLPVVQDGKLLGVFTIADLKKARLGTTKLADVMTRNPVVAFEDEKISDVFEKMTSHRIGRVPVVAKSDRQSFRGLVSLSDLKNLSNKHALREGGASQARALKCKSCTAPLGTPTGRFLKCEYCGTTNEI